MYLILMKKDILEYIKERGIVSYDNLLNYYNHVNESLLKKVITVNLKQKKIAQFNGGFCITAKTSHKLAY